VQTLARVLGAARRPGWALQAQNCPGAHSAALLIHGDEQGPADSLLENGAGSIRCTTAGGLMVWISQSH